MKWLKNLIGELKGIGNCYICKDSFNWKPYHTIEKGRQGKFAVCEKCWRTASSRELFWAYRRLLNRHIQEFPIDYPEKEVNAWLKAIKEAIKNRTIRLCRGCDFYKLCKKEGRGEGCRDMICNGCGMELKYESQTHMRGGIEICNNCGLDIDTGKRPEELEREDLDKV